jgi:hypothetical protein
MALELTKTWKHLACLEHGGNRRRDLLTCENNRNMTCVCVVSPPTELR